MNRTESKRLLRAKIRKWVSPRPAMRGYPVKYITIGAGGGVVGGGGGGGSGGASCGAPPSGGGGFPIDNSTFRYIDGAGCQSPSGAGEKK